MAIVIIVNLCIKQVKKRIWFKCVAQPGANASEKKFVFSTDLKIPGLGVDLI